MGLCFPVGFIGDAGDDDGEHQQTDADPAYFQSEKMTRLAHQAGDMGATWILPVDADEVFYSPQGRLADVLAASPYDIHFAATFEHVPMEWDDPGEPNPLRRIQHRRPNPKPMMKCLAKYHPTMRIWQGNHQIDHPNFPERLGRGVVEIREFQYRTLEQAARKVRNGRAAYEATNLEQTEGSHWREMGAWDDAQLEAWWKGYCAQDVVLDPAPVR